MSRPSTGTSAPGTAARRGRSRPGGEEASPPRGPLRTGTSGRSRIPSLVSCLLCVPHLEAAPNFLSIHVDINGESHNQNSICVWTPVREEARTKLLDMFLKKILKSNTLTTVFKKPKTMPKLIKGGNPACPSLSSLP